MSALLKLIATAAIATAIASPSNAQEQSVGSLPPACCAVGSVRFRDLSKPEMPTGIMVGASNRPVYESHSRTVITSRYGTTVINGVYRSYSR
jgi:hypothetical protein